MRTLCSPFLWGGVFPRVFDCPNVLHIRAAHLLAKPGDTILVPAGTTFPGSVMRRGIFYEVRPCEYRA